MDINEFPQQEIYLGFEANVQPRDIFDFVSYSSFVNIFSVRFINIFPRFSTRKIFFSIEDNMLRYGAAISNHGAIFESLLANDFLLKRINIFYLMFYFFSIFVLINSYDEAVEAVKVFNTSIINQSSLKLVSFLGLYFCTKNGELFQKLSLNPHYCLSKGLIWAIDNIGLFPSYDEYARPSIDESLVHNLFNNWPQEANRFFILESEILESEQMRSVKLDLEQMSGFAYFSYCNCNIENLKKKSADSILRYDFEDVRLRLLLDSFFIELLNKKIIFSPNTNIDLIRAAATYSFLQVHCTRYRNSILPENSIGWTWDFSAEYFYKAGQMGITFLEKKISEKNLALIQKKATLKDFSLFEEEKLNIEFLDNLSYLVFKKSINEPFSQDIKNMLEACSEKNLAAKYLINVNKVLIDIKNYTISPKKFEMYKKTRHYFSNISMPVIPLLNLILMRLLL